MIELIICECGNAHTLNSIEDIISIQKLICNRKGEGFMNTWEIEILTPLGMQFVSIDYCLEVTILENDFYVNSLGNLKGGISLEAVNAILQYKPTIIDGKAMQLKRNKERLNLNN